MTKLFSRQGRGSTTRSNVTREGQMTKDTESAEVLMKQLEDPHLSDEEIRKIERKLAIMREQPN